MENILLIRFKSMGDVVFTLPAVQAVRENFPAAKITYLTSRENSTLLKGFGGVDETIVLDRERLRSGNPLQVVPEFFQLLRRMRSGRFSLVVDFQNYGETAWLTRFTGAPRRWSSFYHPKRRRAYTYSLPDGAPLHPAEAHLELLRRGGLSIGKIHNQFHLPPAALTAARAFFPENKLAPEKPTLFIQAFTSAPQKNWPLENYLAVARHWRERGMQIIFGGGPGDRAALQPAVAENFCVAAGVPLLVSGGLVHLSTFVLGGDTGLLHLAVALGQPVLMLMQQSFTGCPIPFQHLDWVITSSDNKNIGLIPVPMVIAEVSRRLAQ